MADISYVCKRTVVSTKPVRPNLCYLLSVLDRLMEPRHLRIVFYYYTTQKREVGELTVKLRESLSETLTSFPIILGRLQRDEEDRWTIKCNDAGVRVVEARVSGSVDEWLRDVDREKDLRLVHWEEMSHKPYYWSTFYIQMTEFEEGGMAIGLSCIHLLADPFCATAFIDAWAKTTLAQEIHVPPAFVPLPKHHAQDHDHANNSLIGYYKTSITKSIPLTNQRNHSTTTFTFSDNAVRLCIEMAKRTGGIDSDETLSPFEALAGLFWARLGRVKGIKQGPVRMSLGHDVRKILGLEKGFFGNCIVYNTAQLEINDDAGIGVGEAAKAISDAMSQFDRLNVLGLIDWLHLHDHANSLTKGPNGFLGFTDVVCVNLDDVDPYRAGFEVGLDPIRASYYIEPACEMGQILVLPSHEGVGSRDVMVTASGDDLARLWNDDLVQQLGATILMGGNLSSSK